MRRSTSFSGAKRDAAAALALSEPKPWAVRTIRPRGSSIPTSTPLIHPPLPGSKPQAIWPTIANTAPCSISITSWNRIIGRIKRRVRASQHFRSFWGAWRTIAGYEAIHMIRKGQAFWSAADMKLGLLHRFIVGLFAAT